MTNPNIARRIRLSPYRRGMGPTFTLTVYDGPRLANDFFGRFKVRAVLTQHENGKSIVLFDRSDIVLSAPTCPDSDQAAGEILGWYLPEGRRHRRRVFCQLQRRTKALCGDPR